MNQYKNPFRRRLAVGLPVYNGERWLADALDSLLAQSYADFELIISDNASTDATQSICETYANRDSRIQYVRSDVNRGLAWNWNRVFELADSEYFKWAACDDLYAPTFLERCVEVLDCSPDVVWCHTRSRHINDQGELLLGEQTPDISYVIQSSSGSTSSALPCRTSDRPSARFEAVLLGSGGCLDSYGVIRSSILRQSCLYLPYFGSEKVLMAELALWGRYHEVAEPLCFARIHSQATGNLRTRSQQRRCINPFAKKWQSDRLGLLYGYISAVSRAPISLAEKANSYSTIAKYLFQFRKWKSVLLKAWSGQGLAAEYPSVAAPTVSDRTDLSPSLVATYGNMNSKAQMEVAP